MDVITHRSGAVGAVESCIGGRKENQDDFGYADTALGLFVLVCDGMGGGPAGKTASSMARNAMISYVSAAPEDADPEMTLRRAVIKANEKLLGYVEANPSLTGMGTTCIGLLVKGKRGYVVHTGDSRLYQIRNGAKVFRTNDHSYVSELVARGNMTEEEARTSGMSNVITRAIGVQKTVDPEIDIVKIKDGDRFALMTDGIWGTLPEPQLVARLSAPSDPDTVVSEMVIDIDRAGHSRGGGHDNLTLLMVDIPSKDVKKTKAKAAKTDSVPDAGDGMAVECQTPGYSLGQDEDIHKTGGDSRKWKIAAAVLALLLCVSVAVCVKVLFFSKDEVPERRQETVKPDPESVRAVEQAIDAMDKASDNSDSDSDTGVNQEVNMRLEEAKAKLEELLTYGNDMPYDSKQFGQRLEDRNRIREKVIELIGQGLGEEQDPVRKEKIQKILNNLNNNTYIATGIDEPHGKTTLQAIGEIESYIVKIGELLPTDEATTTNIHQNKR